MLLRLGFFSHQGLTKNKPLMTFHEDFNQTSRRVNKKTRTRWQKQDLNISRCKPDPVIDLSTTGSNDRQSERLN